MVSHEECDMDREPLGWTVKRHVVDVAFDESDVARGRSSDRHLVAGPAATVDGRHARVDVESVASGASGGPFPAP